jgi:hypothetical protein
MVRPGDARKKRCRGDRLGRRRRRFEMNRINRGIMAVAIAGSMVSGGIMGGVLVAMNTAAASAATPSPSAAGSGSTAAPAAGTFVSNENATHEAGESAAREAQENAGQMPTVP